MKFLQLDHILGREVMTNPYHIYVIRNPLTRSIAPQYWEIYTEVRDTFDGLVQLSATSDRGKFYTQSLIK